MKKMLFVFLLFVSILGNAQDIDFYHKFENDKFNLPQISWQMSFTEYQLLSRSLRMKDMMYAVIVPGYVHFYAKDYWTGGFLATTRLAAYGVIGYTYYRFVKNNANLTLDEAIKLNKAASYAAAYVIANYIFDWIHGEYVLKIKQERIRYKYSMKLSLLSDYNNSATPGLRLGVKF